MHSIASVNARRVSTRLFTFSGTIPPAVGGRLVGLYRNGTLAAQSRTNMAGVYSTTKTLAGGTFTFYVKTPNDSYNLGATSRSLRVLIS